MKKSIKTAIGQLAEMERFFAGDFSVKGRRKTTSEQEPNAVFSAASQNPAGDLGKIAEEVRQCRKCQIGSARLNAVPGDGSPRARLVFVGEAPGADEDAQGLPFVGRAGQLLDKMIHAMGLKRPDVFICNTLKCRPPENRDPKPDELYNCMPYLKRQLEIIRPEFIVALGAHAAHILLETDKAIGQLRGQFHTYSFSEHANPAQLMPTYHPAYLLRNYSDENRKRVWDDLQKVMAEMGLKK
ncbi:MAG: uracil-DNA glycosylase [Planctomycetes bacterium]|nr:uracil-DNA glycosylase [Planctomycetota bacterium]